MSSLWVDSGVSVFCFVQISVVGVPCSDLCESIKCIPVHGLHKHSEGITNGGCLAAIGGTHYEGETMMNSSTNLLMAECLRRECNEMGVSKIRDNKLIRNSPFDLDELREAHPFELHLEYEKRKLASSKPQKYFDKKYSFKKIMKNAWERVSSLLYFALNHLFVFILFVFHREASSKQGIRMVIYSLVCSDKSYESKSRKK